MSYKGDMGARGEELAAEYLEKNGYVVTARNARVSHDEIDIIAEDGEHIVFVEVKARAQTTSNQRYGRPCAAVDYTKKQKLLRCVTEYLRREKPDKAPRIDVIEVYFPPIREDTPIDLSKLLPTKIKHIRNAVHK